jgi:general secretion pathway protein D
VQIQGKKISVISPGLITPEEAYRLFYAALESVQLTVEPTGKFLRIIESNRARYTTLPFYRDNQRAPTDKRFVTKLIRLTYLDANEVNNLLLQRLKSEPGDIIPYRSTLIITDQGENIDRMSEIIRQFDVPLGRDKIWMLRVRNTSATEMAARLAEILPVAQVGTGGRRAGGSPAPVTQAAPKANAVLPPGDLMAEMTITKIVPDDRSNSLLVIAGDRAYDWLLAIVRKLDTPIEGGGDGRVHIYYCEHANCDELAATLSALTGVSVSGAAAGGARRTTTRPGATPAPIAPSPVPGGQNQQQAGQMQLFEGDVRIAFDGATNALLVMSSLKDFQALRKVIEKLDAPRKQVFVEALILEVLLTKDRTVGVGYHGGKQIDVSGEQSLLLGGFNASRSLNPAGLVTDLGGLTGALFGPALNATQSALFGSNVNIPSFGAFLKLLQTNSDVNVLSNPSLLIMNNQEGEITVGENLPFPGGLLGGFGGLPGQGGGAAGFFPQVSVNRQDVALKLKLVPSVNEHNMIRLEVQQEVSDVSNPNYNNLGPATSTRRTSTIVVARDQQTVVIGGLMADRTAETVEKIPVLGDIPLLGFFFRTTRKEVRKSNIMIALTPYVVADLGDLRRIAEKKLRDRREFIDRYSALEDKAEFESDIDYRRKRGMLEEINRTVREVELEESELRRIREREFEESTPIEIPGGDEAVPGVLPRVLPGATAPSAAPAGAPPAGAAPPPPAGAPAPAAPAAPAPTQQ